MTDEQKPDNAFAESGLNVGLGVETWGEFLAARAKVIDWLAQDHNNTEIAQILSMTSQQVLDIYTRNRTLG